jgi:hypothetical protein
MPEPQNAIPFPCYAIMSNNCKGGVILPRDDGCVAMALFTILHAAMIGSSPNVWKFSVNSVSILDL